MENNIVLLRAGQSFQEATETQERRPETPASFAATLDPEDEAQTTYYIYENGQAYTLGPDGLKPMP